MSYITDMRKKIGHDPLFMPFSSGVLIENNQILLQRRSDDGTWALHGGSLELGETFIDGLKREMQEELNIKIKKYIMIDVYSGKELYHIYPNKDQTFPVGVMYLITDYDGIITPDNDEVMEVKWYDFDKLPSNLFHSDVKMIKDAINFYQKIYYNSEQKEEL